jgi:hypothetical protein
VLRRSHPGLVFGLPPILMYTTQTQARGLLAALVPGSLAIDESLSRDTGSRCAVAGAATVVSARAI